MDKNVYHDDPILVIYYWYSTFPLCDKFINFYIQH